MEFILGVFVIIAIIGLINIIARATRGNKNNEFLIDNVLKNIENIKEHPDSYSARLRLIMIGPEVIKMMIDIHILEKPVEQMENEIKQKWHYQIKNSSFYTDAIPALRLLYDKFNSNLIDVLGLNDTQQHILLTQERLEKSIETVYTTLTAIPQTTNSFCPIIEKEEQYKGLIRIIANSFKSRYADFYYTCPDENTNKKQATAHIENLLLLSYADGRSHQLEKDSITFIAKRCGLSKEEYASTLNRILLEKIPCCNTTNDLKQHLNLFKPKDDAIKFAYINDIITTMLIDGELDERELDICYLIADHFDIERETIVLTTANKIRQMDGNTITDSKGNETHYSFGNNTNSEEVEFDDDTDEIPLWGDHEKTKESEEAAQIATKYFNLIKTGVDEMERRYRELSEEGKIEALFCFSAITLYLRSNFTNTINPDAWQDCYFVLLWNTCCTQKAAFLNNRIKFYQTENDKLLEESLYVPISIYNSIYLNPLSQDPTDIQGKAVPSVTELLEFQMIFMEITMRLSDEEMQITHS